MALPTKDEQAVLELFRENVADILTTEELNDDMYLLRWLRARDLNLEKAEDMLRNAKKWRKENNLDNLVIEKSGNPYYFENFPKFLDGVDKDGRPVLTVPFGKWDIRKIIKDGKSEEFRQYLTQSFEEVFRTIKIAEKIKAGNKKEIGGKIKSAPITQIRGILDWTGFSWGQLFSYQCVQNFLQIGSIYEAYYPEILYQGYFINSPSLVSAVLTLLKPVLAPKTMGKIKCFGLNKDEWKEEILKHFDEEQLRPQFGGTKMDDKNPFLIK